MFKIVITFFYSEASQLHELHNFVKILQDGVFTGTGRAGFTVIFFSFSYTSHTRSVLTSFISINAVGANDMRELLAERFSVIIA